MKTVGWVASRIALAAWALAPVPGGAQDLATFERRLESLRRDAHIPAITAAIVADGRVAWSRGFGIADLSTNRPATDTTVYHFASLTKPFAAAVLLQLVEEGRIALDDPVGNYGIVLPDVPSRGVVTIRHLMSHTSSGVPGTTYRYDGDRYSLLDSVIVRATGNSFATELVRRIVRPHGLVRTAPAPRVAEFSATGLDRDSYWANLARGYTWTRGEQVPTLYPAMFSTAAGLTGSVLDLAAFSIALDRGEVLAPATRDLAFAPTISSTGDTLPYGLGWFSTRHRGERVVWHYGYWTAISSLIIKVPGRGLTFIVLANSDGLSARYPLASGRLESSPWARAFLDAFVPAR